MLESLRVRNLAVVEDVHVTFGDALNVITGETGAGKSVLIGALNLVLGERADRSLIRSGEKQCTIEAVFDLGAGDLVNDLLDDAGLPPLEDGLLIIRRIVNASGAGRNLVNDTSASLQLLKRLGERLVDMHGPHDHQSLLSTDFQLDLLDAFGGLGDPRQAYADQHRAHLDLLAQRRALEGDDQSIARELDILQYQVDEIDQAELDELDEEELRQEHAETSNAERLVELGSAVAMAMTEGDDAILNQLAATQHQLREMADMLTEAGIWEKEAESITVQIQELSRSLADRVSRIDGDPARLQLLDDKVSLLEKLKRKYGPSLEAILTVRNEAQARLSDLSSREERLSSLDAELAAHDATMAKTASKLTKLRIKAARQLADAVTAQLHELGFKDAAFHIERHDRESGPTGRDAIDFGFAPNVGETMRPLRQIASSGEISRVMLALKTVLAQHDRIPLLVFDEIDANVGGEIGNAVGAKMRSVAAHHQVICITHLPQVAVYGKHHHVVSKSVRDDRTYTAIDPVEDAQRTREVARMLGGADLTSVVLEHATQMLAGAQ